MWRGVGWGGLGYHCQVARRGKGGMLQYARGSKGWRGFLGGVGGAEVQVGAPSCVHSYHPCMWARGRGQIITRPEIYIFFRAVLDYYAVTMAQIVTVKCKQTNLKYKFEMKCRP